MQMARGILLLWEGQETPVHGEPIMWKLYTWTPTLRLTDQVTMSGNCKYCNITQSFTTGAPVPIHIRGHTTVAYGDKIVLMGGYEANSCSSYKGYTRAIYE